MDSPARPPLIHQLLGAIQTAEHALASGLAAQALATLNHPAAWITAEVQSAARLAAAHLENADEMRGTL